MNHSPVTKPVFVSVVAPVYNEAPVVRAFVKEVRTALADLPWRISSELILVNDGSTDGTAECLDEMAREFSGQCKVIHLCRNFGHSAAISAGLDHATGHAVILMDADLQDDPAAF